MWAEAYISHMLDALREGKTVKLVVTEAKDKEEHYRIYDFFVGDTLVLRLYSDLDSTILRYVFSVFKEKKVKRKLISKSQHDKIIVKEYLLYF